MQNFTPPQSTFDLLHHLHHSSVQCRSQSRIKLRRWFLRIQSHTMIFLFKPWLSWAPSVEFLVLTELCARSRCLQKTEIQYKLILVCFFSNLSTGIRLWVVSCFHHKKYICFIPYTLIRNNFWLGIALEFIHEFWFPKQLQLFCFSRKPPWCLFPYIFTSPMANALYVAFLYDYIKETTVPSDSLAFSMFPEDLLIENASLIL